MRNKVFDFRPGDIVEVTPTPLTKPFKGVVVSDKHHRRSSLNWRYIWVKPFRNDNYRWIGGWYPKQLTLVYRPTACGNIPDNIILGEN